MVVLNIIIVITVAAYCATILLFCFMITSFYELNVSAILLFNQNQL